MKFFLFERWQENKIKLNHYPPLLLRTEPEILGDRQVGTVLSEFGYFDKKLNKTGNGLFHLYEAQVKQCCQLVIDHTTGLTLQQGGSEKCMVLKDAQKFIDGLNRSKFAGFSDWRLPTLEEAMSLVEPEKKHGDRYLDLVFDKAQRWIWTADKYKGPDSGVWGVHFIAGYCFFNSNLFTSLGQTRKGVNS